MSIINERNLVKFIPVIETYVNGTSWYRIYADGWCEQGGRIAASSSTSQTNILLKTMIDTNYNINITAESSNWTGGLNSDIL